MTHNELLAKIDEEGEFQVQHFDAKPRMLSALRAVVELHKPWLLDEVLRCSCADYYTDGFSFYPCETIQAIEKELT
jgi:hypothetical protein